MSLNLESENASPNRGGRPTKFNAERAERAITLAGQGARRDEIAKAVGVGMRTLANWLAVSQSETDSLFSHKFRQAEEKAKRRRFRTKLARRTLQAQVRWQEFRHRDQRRYWMNRLGPVEFWRRRLAWFERRELTELPGYDRALAAYEAAKQAATA